MKTGLGYINPFLGLFFWYWFPWNHFPPGIQNEKDYNLPSIILLLLLIIEFLSHFREEPKLIEAEHAVQADFCPASSDNTGHLGTHQEASPSRWRLACKDRWSEIACTCRGWSQQPRRHRRRSKWLRSGLQNRDESGQSLPTSSTSSLELMNQNQFKHMNWLFF